MKNDIVELVAWCLDCKQEKVEHQRPGSFPRNIELLEWKWEIINMDFIILLQRSRMQYDLIWVIVDKMTKLAHFFPIKTTNSTEDYAMLYIKKVGRLHGLLV